MSWSHRLVLDLAGAVSDVEKITSKSPTFTNRPCQDEFGTVDEKPYVSALPVLYLPHGFLSDFAAERFRIRSSHWWNV